MTGKKAIANRIRIADLAIRIQQLNEAVGAITKRYPDAVTPIAKPAWVTQVIYHERDCCIMELNDLVAEHHRQ